MPVIPQTHLTPVTILKHTSLQIVKCQKNCIEFKIVLLDNFHVRVQFTILDEIAY